MIACSAEQLSRRGRERRHLRLRGQVPDTDADTAGQDAHDTPGVGRRHRHVRNLLIVIVMSGSHLRLIGRFSLTSLTNLSVTLTL